MLEFHIVFGSGPVGLAVVDTLVAQGKRIRVVSRSGARRAMPASVEVARGGQLYGMAFERGIPQGKLKEMGRTPNRRGTLIRFKPDAQIGNELNQGAIIDTPAAADITGEAAECGVEAGDIVDLTRTVAEGDDLVGGIADVAVAGLDGLVGD